MHVLSHVALCTDCWQLCHILYPVMPCSFYFQCYPTAQFWGAALSREGAELVLIIYYLNYSAIARVLFYFDVVSCNVMNCL